MCIDYKSRAYVDSSWAQSAGAEKHTNFFSAEKYELGDEYFRYDIKTSDGEASVLEMLRIYPFIYITPRSTLTRRSCSSTSKSPIYDSNKTSVLGMK